MIDKGRCDDGFICNPSICECDKSCNVREFLDCENCKCTERLIDNLVGECSQDINGNEIVYNTTLNDHGRVYKSCTIYMVLLIITFIIVMDIGSACIYFYLHTIKNCFNKLPY